MKMCVWGGGGWGGGEGTETETKCSIFEVSPYTL